MNGKTRDFCEVRAILNEKTRHSHGRDSENPVKMHAKVTSYSENPVPNHPKDFQYLQKPHKALQSLKEQEQMASERKNTRLL